MGDVRPEYTPLLDGIALTGIASLRAETPIRVGPLAQVNFLIGKNNHGKSTLLRATKHFDSKASSSSLPAGAEREVLIAVENDALLRKSVPMRNSWRKIVATAQTLGAIPYGDGFAVWAKLGSSRNALVIDEGFWFQIFGARSDVGRLGNVLSQFVKRPEMAHIPAFREVQKLAEGQDPDPDRGWGLIEEIARWQHPDLDDVEAYRAAKDRFTRLEKFVRAVLEDSEAAIEVPASQKALHVRLSQSGEWLPLDSLGDGTKQVIMIAAAATRHSSTFITLEEPEIHLHAGLQRKLMTYLRDFTDNQYLIATHSAHILDTGGASIFHVVHDGHTTTVSAAVGADDIARIGADLGYRASDLLQANYTVWVEGPADRIYWRKWLSLVAPDLREGVHYSVMTYGGRLVDQLSLHDHDPELETDLIFLLRLGRRCAIIADSDKTSAYSHLHKTIQRLIAEAETSETGYVIVPRWCRTVENLVPRDKLEAAVAALHPHAVREFVGAADGYSDPFSGLNSRTYSKPRIAVEVVKHLTLKDMDRRLKKLVDELAARVREANGASIATIEAKSEHAPSANHIPRSRDLA